MSVVSADQVRRSSLPPIPEDSTWSIQYRVHVQQGNTMLCELVFVVIIEIERRDGYCWQSHLRSIQCSTICSASVVISES
jgi:hypothetical protein